MGISLRNSGHLRVVASAGAGSLLARETSAFTGSTTKKYTATAMMRNDSKALLKLPKRNLLLLISNVRAEKSGSPAIAATSGVRRSLTKA
jgi:hypothetical protein